MREARVRAGEVQLRGVFLARQRNGVPRSELLDGSVVQRHRTPGCLPGSRGSIPLGTATRLGPKCEGYPSKWISPFARTLAPPPIAASRSARFHALLGQCQKPTEHRDPVAQPNSALVYDTRGRRFESCQGLHCCTSASHWLSGRCSTVLSPQGRKRAPVRCGFDSRHGMAPSVDAPCPKAPTLPALGRLHTVIGITGSTPEPERVSRVLYLVQRNFLGRFGPTARTPGDQPGSEGSSPVNLLQVRVSFSSQDPAVPWRRRRCKSFNSLQRARIPTGRGLRRIAGLRYTDGGTTSPSIPLRPLSLRPLALTAVSRTGSVQVRILPSAPGRPGGPQPWKLLRCGAVAQSGRAGGPSAILA